VLVLVDLAAGALCSDTVRLCRAALHLEPPDLRTPRRPPSRSPRCLFRARGRCRALSVPCAVLGLIAGLGGPPVA